MIHYCDTCTHWNKCFPGNTNLGLCKAIGAISWEEANHIALTSDKWSENPTTDFEGVRVEFNFGCVNHSNLR